MLLLFSLALVFNVSATSAASVIHTNTYISSNSLEKMSTTTSGLHQSTSKDQSSELNTNINTTTKTNSSKNLAAGAPIKVNGLTLAQLKDGVSRVQAFYMNNGRLPNYVSYGTRKIPISTFKKNIATQGLKIDTSMKPLTITSSIPALAKSLTASSTSAYDKAVKIFSWVRDNITYSFYYNTKYGASGTLQSRTGNCVDSTHLLIALARSAGISARYVHGTCQFSSGTWYGHVWAQLYVNGKWTVADATSYRNTLGVIKNWNTATYKLNGIYNTLPF